MQVYLCRLDIDSIFSSRDICVQWHCLVHRKLHTHSYISFTDHQLPTTRRRRVLSALIVYEVIIQAYCNSDIYKMT